MARKRKPKNGDIKYYCSWIISENEWGEKYFEDKYEAEEFRYSIIDKGGRCTVETVIRCCDEDLYCGGFTNVCEICGRLYNMNGTSLKPREQGEEDY